MARTLIRRVAFGVIAVLGVAVLAFLLEFVVPGDPARAIAPRAQSAAVLENIRIQLHLNRPLIVQFLDYFGELFRGNLGTSYVQRQSVTSLIGPRLLTTGWLALAGVIAEVIIGGTLGILSTLYPRLRAAVAAVNLTFLALPQFVVGLVLLLIFGFRLHMAPVTGGAGPAEIVLPALTLGLVGAPWYSQIVADQMADSLSSAYVRTAVAKGLPDRYILWRHVLRNVLSPAITMIGMDLGAYLSGVVTVEVVFGWPGIGLLAVNSLQNLDRPVVMGTVIVGAIAVVLFNLIADVLRMYVDPRTREEPA
ncbi:MAG TPA: ABC transporter permease [Streptosporangiaceae bacterium]|nr:ABC transporter permease [Streptosporangiaceae bacterium]